MRGGGLVRRGGVGRRDGVEDDRRGANIVNTNETHDPGVAVYFIPPIFYPAG